MYARCMVEILRSTRENQVFSKIRQKWLFDDKNTWQHPKWPWLGPGWLQKSGKVARTVCTIQQTPSSSLAVDQWQWGNAVRQCQQRAFVSLDRRRVRDPENYSNFVRINLFECELVCQQDRWDSRGWAPVYGTPYPSVVPCRGVRPSASVWPTGLTQGELVLKCRGCLRPSASPTHQTWG